MKKKTLYLIWGGLYILCALLGFIPEPEGIVKALVVLAAAVFFVPGWMLFYQALKSDDRSTLRVIRTLSLVSLCATVIFLVLNFLSAGNSNVSGDLLYGFLIIFSAPMICSQYWAISLFLWACLLMASISYLRKVKK